MGLINALQRAVFERDEVWIRGDGRVQLEPLRREGGAHVGIAFEQPAQAVHRLHGNVSIARVDRAAQHVLELIHAVDHDVAAAADVGPIQGLNRERGDVADHAERRDEREDVGEVRQQHDERSADHREGDGVPDRAAIRARGCGHPDAQQHGQHEERQDRDVLGFTHEQRGDAVVVTGGGELDDDRNDGDRDTEHRGDHFSGVGDHVVHRGILPAFPRRCAHRGRGC